jgi:hypothetical protein
MKNQNICHRCNKHTTTKDYGPLGMLCYNCEREPINGQQAVGCAVYFIGMAIFFLFAVWFLAHMG